MTEQKPSAEQQIDRMNELLVQNLEFHPGFGLFRGTPIGASGNNITGFDWNKDQDRSGLSEALHVKIVQQVCHEVGMDRPHTR